MSANNSQKMPLARSLNEFAERKIADSNQHPGKRWPCQVVSVSGAIVTVKLLVTSDFTLPQIKVPIQQSVYQRLPVQVNDLGYLQAADVRLGNVTGLGNATPDLSTPANLAVLVYVPVGNSTWPAMPDANSHVIQGPNGVSLWDIGQKSTVVLTPNGIVCVGQNTISMTVGSNSIVIDSSAVHITGTLMINGHDYTVHKHSGVTTGGSNSGGVVP